MATALERAAAALYTPALVAATPLLAVLYGIKAWRTGKYLPIVRERLGLAGAPVASGGVWLHAVSVGEVMAARTLARALRARLTAPVVLSSTTAAGLALARQACERAEVAAAVASPLDYPGAVARAFARIRPRAIVLVEAELWPNWLREAARQGVPVALVNARISARSFARFRRARALFRPLLAGLALATARTAEDADRLAALGVPAARLAVTGDLKFDLPTPSLSRAEARARFQLPPDGLVFAAGSIHDEESAAVAAAFRALLASDPRAVLLYAPRKSFAVPAALAGLPLARRSEGAATGSGGVLLLDTMGELGDAYRAADFAFVGGSLIAGGGHNLLEPAAAGIPVLFGPFTETFAGPAARLIAVAAGERVANAAELARAVVALGADGERRAEAGRRALAVIAAGRGALERTLERLVAVLPPPA